MIKLVASDIDGTLLPEGTAQINPEIFEVIRKLKEKDILFAAASGRHYTSMSKLFAPVEHDMIFITENGAYVCCRGYDMLEQVHRLGAGIRRVGAGGTADSGSQLHAGHQGRLLYGEHRPGSSSIWCKTGTAVKLLLWRTCSRSGTG